ncbi:GGDEF domain-containing protein [Metabacillus fastidiosus]|uniref:GGDEF domain-containing protein n=1 Tax=Metabacillus fastidiosus TaxID=1458 RepID=UPI0008252CDE|nr:GGDEF domain-containing protein [Metabacillus fastidiosus]MED4462485.1 GGDEF domain-containing protein [Metabacillus fastidiosus]
MKYTGRLSLLLIVVAFTLFQIFVTKDPLNEQAFDTLISAIIAWFVGKQYDKMRFYAEKDFLTELYNRRFTNKFFSKLKKKADSNKLTLGVFMIDINNFKQTNDKYGHETGDKALKLLSETIRKNIEKSDIAIRWGGDEFMILIPAVTPELADKMITQINNEFVMSINKDWTIDSDFGLSAGLAMYPADGENIGDLSNIADRRMYTIKSNSKNID